MEVISSIYNSGYNIKKFYLGSRELNLAYLGNQVIYDEVIGDNDLNYILYEFYGSDTLPNTVEAPVKSATLKGSTKYRDIDTGDILDTFDETKNLELVSVKVPVLTTGTSRNMWSKVNDSGETYAGYRRLSKLKIPVFEGETIYIRATGGAGYSGVVTYDENGEKIKDLLSIIGDVMENTYIVEKGVKYIAPAPHQRYAFSENETIMYNRGSGYLPYEENVSGDYKSNILSCNEEVELCAVGDVKDELNLLTGEMTKRYGVAIMDGSDDENYFDNYNEISFVIYGEVDNQIFSNIKKNSYNILCDKYYVAKDKYDGWRIHNDSTATGIYWLNNNLWIRIPLENLGGSHTKQAFKTWLQSNPITIQYELATPVVKTVDLTIVDQDGKTINKLNSFNGTTHVSTEVAENSTYPMVSLEVASELQAAMSKVAEDIELIKPVQNDIETTIDTQSNDIDSLLLATTELFEMIL